MIEPLLIHWKSVLKILLIGLVNVMIYAYLLKKELTINEATILKRTFEKIGNDIKKTEINKRIVFFIIVFVFN